MNNEIKIYTATNLQYLRKLNKKTQQDIGNLCGKGDTAVSNWEKGIRDPDGVDLAKISNYFGITVDDLMFRDLRFDDINNIQLSERELLFNKAKDILSDSEWATIEFIMKNAIEEKEVHKYER